MQTSRRLPCTISYAANELAMRSGRLQGQAPAIACNGQFFAHQAFDPNLNPLDRRIDIPRRSSCARLFTKHVPRFDRLPQLQLHTFVAHTSVNRETKFGMRSEPLAIQRIAGLLQIFYNRLKVPAPQSMAVETDREDAYPSGSVLRRTARARTRPPVRAPAVAEQDSSGREAASRRRAFPPARAVLSHCPVSRVYRCRTPHDAYCRSRRRADC